MSASAFQKAPATNAGVLVQVLVKLEFSGFSFLIFFFILSSLFWGFLQVLWCPPLLYQLMVLATSTVNINI